MVGARYVWTKTAEATTTAKLCHRSRGGTEEDGKMKCKLISMRFVEEDLLGRGTGCTPT